MVRFIFTVSDFAPFPNMKVDTQAIARDAKSSNAVQLALSLEILPGVPFPAGLVADYRDWPYFLNASGVTLAQRLSAILPSGEVLDLAVGVAIRSLQSTSIRQGAEQVPDIKLEYFPLRAGRKVVAPRAGGCSH